MLDPDKFPLLLGVLAGNPKAQLAAMDAIHTISQGISASSMRKVVHDDLKFLVSRVVEDAWNKLIQEKYFFGGKYESLPQEVQDLQWSITVSNLHEVLAAKKKLDKSAATGDAVTAMRALVDEIHPLSLAMAGLKAVLIKGRAPPDPEKAAANENPDKIVKTCSCCFRGIAIAGKTMAHHGFERPGSGEQTASCAGVRFRPLEVSSDGLKWVLSKEREYLAAQESSLEKSPLVQKISRGRGKIPAEVTRDDPMWKMIFSAYVANIESNIRFSTRTVNDLENRLETWVQTESEDLKSVRKAKARNP